MKQRILAVLLIVAMLLSACATTQTDKPDSNNPEATKAAAENNGEEASPEDDNFNATGYPIVKEKITITAFGNQNITHKNWSELYCFNAYEEISNIHIDWTTAPNQGYTEKKNVLLASGEYPDMFYRAKLQVSDLINYGSKGALMPLNDLIEKYAYNFNERAKEFPSMVKEITMPDGNIYSMPTANSSLASRSVNNWVNTRWLKNVGLDMPESYKDFEEVLTAFKEKDANGNGDASDEIPYSDRARGNSIFQSTYCSFGIGNLGNTMFNEYVDLGEDNKVRMFAVTDSFKKQLEWIKGLYDKGLLDEEMFTQDIPTFTAKGEQDLIGSFFQNNSPEIIGGKNADDFQNVGPLANDEGKKSFNNVDTMCHIGAFAISNTNKYPKESVRWVDYYYGKEGDLMIRLGKEDLTYTVNEDGSYALTDLILNNPDGLNVPQAIGQHAIAFAGGACPEYIFEEYEQARLVPATFTGWDVNAEYFDVVDLVNPSFTTEEQEQLNALTADIKTYVDESKVRFITGKMSFDDWDEYVKTIEKMGLDDYVAIYQAAYDRWSK
jgi:putative aldouronate transport system substrate-binding protein